MKKFLLVLISFAILTSLTASTILAATTKKPVKNVKKTVKTKIVKPKTVKSKKVLSKKNAKSVKGVSIKKVPVILSKKTNSSLINCNMPDGKMIKATQIDCDNVTNFWKNHPKPSSHSSGGGSSGLSSNNNSGSNNSGSSSNSSNNNPAPTATPTPTPTPATTISNVEILPCTSTSCSGYITVKVTGTQFNAGSRIELTDNGKVIGENSSNFNYPDAQLVGGDGSTEIIMDFYKVPDCTLFGVQVKVTSSVTITSPLSILTQCI